MPTRKRDAVPGLLLMAVLTSLIGGAIAGSFAWMENWLTNYRLAALHSTTGIVLMVLLAGVTSGLGFWLIKRFAPQAVGSGVPEVEGALDNIRPVPWQRVIPVKFLSGLAFLGSGMVLGREGPSVQMGAYAGQAVGDTFRANAHVSHILMATGAAAGLAAAFNAPLAGILFVVEEMRPQFRYGLISVKSVFIGAIIGTLVMRLWTGQTPVLEVPVFHLQLLESLWLYLLLGAVFGVLGIVFNRSLIFSLCFFSKHFGASIRRFVCLGVFLGVMAALLTLLNPSFAGGGLRVIDQVISYPQWTLSLFVLFIVRFMLTMVYYGSGAAGGIFAPMLALGTLAGLSLGHIAHSLFPHMLTSPGVFAIAGMGALFAATVRAPLTGTVLVLEMTNNYSLVLPMIITCLGATMVAQWLGGKPIYSELLERTLKAQADAS